MHKSIRNWLISNHTYGFIYLNIQQYICNSNSKYAYYDV